MTDFSAEPVISVPPPAGLRRGLLLLLCSVIFLAGAVLGSGVTLLLKVEQWPRPRKSLPERRDQITRRIASRLSLDARQTEKLRAIVERRLRHMEAIRRKIQPEMTLEAESLNRELRAILKPAQVKRWDELYTELKDRWFPPLTTENGKTVPSQRPSSTRPTATSTAPLPPK